MKRDHFRVVVLVAIMSMLAALMGFVPGVGAQEDEEIPRKTAPDTQSDGEWDGDSFAGYPADDADYPADDDPESKTEELGEVGTNSPDAEDVPGAPAPPGTDDGATLIAPGDMAGDSADALRAAVAAAAAGDPGEAAATPEGTLRVVVSMNLAVQLLADLSDAEAASQQEAIDASMATLAGLLAGTDSTVVRAYEVIPSAVATVDSAGLEALLASSDVAAIQVDQAFEPALDVSTGVIDSDLLNQAGVLGNNYEGSTGGAYEVAILDSGVRPDHDAFGSRVVAQACFSATSWCPNGGAVQIGGNAGAHCAYTSGAFTAECWHGTHVAGIAAGGAFSGGHEGVARGAGIVAVQVGHRSCSFPNYCWRYFFSDLDLALGHVVALKNGGRNIAAVNMSLGGPLSTGVCDAGFPATQNLFAQLDALQVAPVAAAGNNGSQTQVTYPSCLSGSYAVSATNDADVPAGFSNSNALTNWWAPGVSIDAAFPTSTTAHGNFSGTSMAAPHVAGGFALLRECIGNSTDEAVAADLNATGVNVTRNAVTRKRINVLDAATQNVNNNDFAFPEVFNGDGPINDYDWNVCADAEAGEPGPGSIENSIWWTWTPSTTGTATISTNDGGGNVTTFDTVLSVFQGNSLGSLNLLAHDDDGGVGLRSLVNVPVNGGQTYRIRVDGFAAANGELNLHIENGPPPTCRGIPATIVGTVGDDNIVGTPGNDTIVAGNGNDTVDGGGGNDTICGGAGNDTLDGGSGNDTIDGETGVDHLDGGTGADSMFGGPQADHLLGGTGNDFMLGNAGFGDLNDVGDTLEGQDGDDILDGWVGNDVILGGAGFDQLLGAVGNDILNGGSDGDDIFAGDGADTAFGQGGNDYIDGGSGGDTLLGFGESDTIFGGLGSDIINGGPGNDILRGDDNNDSIFGQGGTDDIAGGAGNDFIIGLDGNDTIEGDTGDDVVNGGPGVDTVSGGSQNDTLYGLTGNDILNGDGGDDRIFGQIGNDAINGGLGNDFAWGNEQNDVLNDPGGTNVLNGGPGDDVATGGSGPDQIFGDGDNSQAGDDTLLGGGGSDFLLGFAGNDSINSVDGFPDTVNGGPGADNCTTEAIDTVFNCP
ncbi:MAG: S8 family serine peptidase [Acidimicrobiales bacterium]